MLRNDLILRAARRQRTERTPVWLMRQAGRFDPAYRAIRERDGLALEQMFCQPDLAAEISLLPARFGVDAIIIFQDILTPLTPMGAEFHFRPGPILDAPLRTRADVKALRCFDPSDQLGFVSDTLHIVRRTLNGDLPVLGFAGAPLTLAFFLIEGGSPGQQPLNARALMRDDPALMHQLLKQLADMTADYLALQIESGADALQLFESVGDLLTPHEYREFAHPYHVRIFSKLANRVPTILFVKDRPVVDLMALSGASVLSIGSGVNLAAARQQWGGKVAFQGNVDNRLIATGTFEQIDEAVRTCVVAGGHQGHILNLSHGLLKETPVEHVCRFIETGKTTRIDCQSEIMQECQP